jgi:hypothetical protein
MLPDTSEFAFHESTSATRSWSHLSAEDKQNYLNLRAQSVLQSRPHQKDRNPVVFRNEVRSIIDFIDSSPANREHRAIICGLVVRDPFILVNNRQLKHVIGRCKSSINGSFQQIGYLAVKTKDKARECTKLLIPSLATDPGQLKLWTVRFNRFVNAPGPAVPGLPLVTAEDLCEDSKRTEICDPVSFPPTNFAEIRPPPPVSKPEGLPPETTVTRIAPIDFNFFPYDDETEETERPKAQGCWDGFAFGSAGSDFLGDFWNL